MKTDSNLQIDISRAGKLACESCGAEFTCNAGKEHCWCSEVKVSPGNLTAIQENFGSCLCRECLQKLEVKTGDQTINS